MSVNELFPNLLFSSYLAKLKEKKKHKKKPEVDGEAEDDPRSELTADELKDPFFASLDDDGDANEYDPIRMMKARSKEDKKKSASKAEPGDGKEDLDLLAMDMDEDGRAKKHFNLDRMMKVEKLMSKKKLHKKDRKKLEEALKAGASGDPDFNVDVADPRFSAVYTSHEFNVDPSDPMYKPTPGMKAILEEKQKRRRDQPLVRNSPEKFGRSEGGATRGGASEISALVQNVKRKAASNVQKSGKRAKLFGRS